MDAKLIPEQTGFRPVKSEPDEAHRRWLREVPDHWCCLRGRVFCLRHGQPPTPPQQGARDDWRRTPDRPDTHHAGKQTFLRGADPWTGRRAVGDDNERDYHREVYWHRCCSTSTPTTNTYTPTLAASSMQTTCASRRKETTSTTSKRYSRQPFKDTDVCFPPNEERSKRELIVVWNGTRLSNTTTPVYLGSHLGRTLCYKTHIEKTNMKVNARNNIIPKLANSKWGCKASNSDPAVSPSATQLPNTPVLCGQGLHTSAQAEAGPTRLLPNHLGLPQTNELGQCTPTGWYRPSSHLDDCCLPHGTDRRQTPTVPSPTSC